jgi:hypothetical protein
MLSALAKGAIGDAYAQKNQPKSFEELHQRCWN